MIRAALLGAILVHPVLFLAVFLSGMVFGARDSWGGNAPTFFGWQGGLEGVKNALSGYLMTLGLVPLGLSVAGAGLCVGACLLARLRGRNRANSRVAWGTTGAVIGALGGMAAIIVMNINDEWTGAIGAGVVGAIVGGVLWGMGSWLPRTVGGGLGGIVGWCLAASGPDTVLIGAVGGIVTAVLVGAVVGELSELFSANQPNPEDRTA